MKRCKISILFLVHFIGLSTQIYGHGFGAQTFVKTRSQGSDCWQGIEQLYNYDIDRCKVKSYHPQLLNCAYQSINCVGTGQTNCYIRLWFDDYCLNTIECTPSQEFYVVGCGWAAACQLYPGQRLFRDNQDGRGQDIIITKIELVKKSSRVYVLEVDHFHTFLVGQQSILTHNMPLGLDLFFEIAIAFGDGAAVGASAGSFFGPVTIGVGASLLGLLGIGVYLLTSGTNKPRYRLEFDGDLVERLLNYNENLSKKSSNSFKKSKNYSIGSGNKKPDDKDKEDEFTIPPIPEKKDKEVMHAGPNGTYKNAPYHGKNGNSIKGPAPKNGQKALDQSCLYKEKGNTNYQRRVAAVDGEYVVLDETGNKEFHGHTRPWHELEDDMQDVLIDVGIVNKKGKIL